MSEKKGILLESGTGEFEVLKFKVAGKHYAINVIKVREILQVEDVSSVPNSPKAISGITLVRGEVVSVIDLKYVLEGSHMEEANKKMTLLCEFNQLKVAFLVDEVMGIHRIRWEQLQKPDEILDASLVIGNINLEGRIFMLLDFERIVMDISPSTGITADRMKDVAIRDRSGIKLVLADDSPMIRQVLKDTLTMAGFINMRFFDDGKKAWDYLSTIADTKEESYTDEVHLMITDIEMPQMDGHALTKQIKQHKYLKHLPVIIFSSLISGDLKHKGESVGADGQLSKPEVAKLIDLVDTLIAKELSK